MTRVDDELHIEEKLVVCFDMCSSSAILEDLLATDNLRSLRDLLISTKDFIRLKSHIPGLLLYKFIGDGWILLFPPRTSGSALLDFLTRLSKRFSKGLANSVVPRLQSTPDVMGLTFGVDKGRLVRTRMMEQVEYIGRALNVASRLQGAIKDKDHNPAYKVLISKHAYTDLAIPVEDYSVEPVTRKLRNIQGGKRLEFMKLKLRV